MTRGTWVLAVVLALLLLGLAAPTASAEEAEPTPSVLATWTCSGTPCPWGPATTSQAAVWPAAAEPVRTRLGYTTSHDVYARAPKVAGWTVTVTTGEATVYAGTSDGSHRGLATLSGGQSFVVPATLGVEELVSLQSGSTFGYTLVPGVPAPSPSGTPTSTQSAGPSPTPTAGSPTTTASPTPTPSSGPTGSLLVRWSCTGSPCPWGDSTTSEAAVWPAAAEPVRTRHGYTTSHDVYAPAPKVAGWTLAVTTGEATVYAGTWDGSHRALATVAAGQKFVVPTTLGADELVSLQSGSAFGYTLVPMPKPSSSVLAAWVCTGTSCPWGDRTTSEAAVWPAAAEPARTRHGYTTSDDVYARAPRVAGWMLVVTGGAATVYAGPVDGSHVPLATLTAGQGFTVPGSLAADAMVSLQSGSAFAYAIVPGTPGLVPDPTASPSPTPGGSPTGQPSSGPPSSLLVRWSCTGSPCPWGDSTTSEAAVWPAAAEPVRTRHGYTTSHDVYAPAPKVAGWTMGVTTGEATVYSGTPDGAHRALATLTAGQSFVVPATLPADEVVSLQSGSAFTYTLVPGSPGGSPTPSPGSTASSTPRPGGTGGSSASPSPAACTDPTRCDPVSWIESRWRYNGTGTDPGDWYGGVIAWPSWSAYSTNNRPGEDSRAVYSVSGEKLYPYMGAWADGCEIEVVSGSVLVIEWERGRNDWRETNLSTGDTYTIDLTGSEDGAMIETPNDIQPFEVSLSSCTPQPIDKGTSD